MAALADRLRCSDVDSPGIAYAATIRVDCSVVGGVAAGASCQVSAS